MKCPTYSKLSAILVAALVLLLGSCQARQGWALSLGLEHVPALHKGKATAAGTSIPCAGQEIEQAGAKFHTYSEAVANVPQELFVTIAPQPTLLQWAAPRGSPATKAFAPPLYILYKRLKKGA